MCSHQITCDIISFESINSPILLGIFRNNNLVSTAVMALLCNPSTFINAGIMTLENLAEIAIANSTRLIASQGHCALCRSHVLLEINELCWDFTRDKQHVTEVGYVLLIFLTPTLTNIRFVFTNFDTATNTISNLLKVEHVRSRSFAR